ncbi:hypothetical protein R3W88_032488 [Solanum pinnatisectum]|uniref:Uncharacterized protein n=1 Tax=Solanum pinnatisectum TaxID=50273 RepID=A0AAV9LPB5_9SOLN|nr:hypothetical protein R3W88_032488 [Solanum pinnatisectum]
MAAMATGQPPLGEVGQTQGLLEEKKISYANTLVAPKTQHQSIQIKPLTYLHEVTTKHKFGALDGEADKQDSFTQNAEEGIKIIPIQQKAVTQQEENKRESETRSSNFHLKEDNIGLEQIDRLEQLIDKDTGSNDTQLEAHKSMADKKKEWGKVNALELEIEDDLPRKEADSFITPRIDKKKPQDIQEKLNTKEEENMDTNIHCISREGDLSLRQIAHLKGRYENHMNNHLGISYVNT